MGDLLGRACGWIASNLDLIAPTGHADPGHAVDPDAQLGTLLDLAIVARAIRQHRPSPEATALAETLLRRISASFAATLANSILTNPLPSLKGCLWLFGVLRDTGQLAGAPDPVLPAMASGYAGWTSARGSAYDVLELGYILDLAGIPHALPPPPRLIASGALDRVLEPASTTTVDAYRTTHAILYLSDLGAAPPADLPPATARLAVASVDRLLRHYRAAGHWDLTAELLLCQHILAASVGRPPDRAAAASLRAAQLRDGSMPGSSSSLHATLAAILYATVTTRANAVETR